MAQPSIQSNDRNLTAWFNKINNGEIKLPRFQRMEAWDPGRISGLFTVIANNLPVGITLILQVDTPQFVDRYLATAPQTGSRTIEHLLDGQQRLTAFWRAVNNNYPSETYFILVPSLLPQKEDDPDLQPRGAHIGRWTKNSKRYPLWADDPAEILAKGYIPCELLKPIDIGTVIDNWISAALKKHYPQDRTGPDAFNKLEDYQKKVEMVRKIITDLREIVKHFNLPFLALPSTTHKTVALEVFRLMNTNSKPLTLYDIIVAEVEGVKGTSLHDLKKDLSRKVVRAEKYVDLGNLILSVAALLQDKVHSLRGQVDMDKKLMIDNWDKLELGIERMVRFLESQHIYDAQRLPTNAILPAIAALYAFIPETGDKRGIAEIILKKYLWRAFFSERYENSTVSRAFQDYKALKALLMGEIKENGSPWILQDVPIFSDEYPVLSYEALLTSKWPKGENVKGRAILAVANLLGAFDFADGISATASTIEKREYHHLFPAALLSEAAINPHLALNCALITDKTNRNIGRKEPLKYVQERVNGTATEDIIRQRLHSHLIPFNELKTGDYDNLDQKEFVEKITIDFSKFLKQRAQLVHAAAIRLADGQAIEAATLINEVSAKIKNEGHENSDIEDTKRAVLSESVEEDFVA